MSYCLPIALSGIASDCNSNLGGIQKVFIKEHEDDDFVVAYYEKESGSPTSFIENVTKVNHATAWKEYNLLKNASSLAQTATIDAANGIRFVDTTLSLVFGRQESVKRLEVSALLLGQVSVIVVDSNGNFQCLGCTEAVECSESTGEIGAAKTDPNRYSITLSDTSGLYAPFMTAAAIEEFLDERTSN